MAPPGLLQPVRQDAGPGNLGVQQDQDEHRDVRAAQRTLIRTALGQAHRREQPSEPGDRRQRVGGDAEREQRRMTREPGCVLRAGIRQQQRDQRFEDQSAPRGDGGERA